MGFGMLGNLAGKYNSVNEKITGDTAFSGSQEQADNFLGNWINSKLPGLITDLAIRVVDDGSGTVAKEILDAGQGGGILGGLFK